MLTGGQAGAFAGGQHSEVGANPFPIALDFAAIKGQTLVNNRQILGIVEKATAGVDLGIDLDPEIHRRLQFRGPGKVNATLGQGNAGCRAKQQGQQRTGCQTKATKMSNFCQQVRHFYLLIQRLPPQPHAWELDLEHINNG